MNDTKKEYEKNYCHMRMSVNGPLTFPMRASV